MNEINIIRGIGFLETIGFRAIGQQEIKVRFNDVELDQAAMALISTVENYVRTSNSRIGPDETMSFGYWLVKFRSLQDNLLEVWEYNSDATEFVLGANLALRYWKEQREICDHFQGEFSPPRPDHYAAISAGVLEGEPIEGVRYPSPEHMSGWWLTTASYDGNVDSLKVTHLYHVTAARPDLARFLALPNGFRFDSKAGDVWFDANVAQEKQV